MDTSTDTYFFYDQMTKKTFFFKLLQLALLSLLVCYSGNIRAQSPGGVSSNLRLWLKGNAGTSTTTNNVAMSSWQDQSGNGRNATQSTTSEKPIFRNNSTDDMNFNAVVHFTAANLDYFTIPTSTLPTGTGPFSIYIVSRKSSNNGMTEVGIGKSANNASVNVGTNGVQTARFHTYNNAWAPSVSTLVNGAVLQSTYHFQSAMRYLSVNSISYGSRSASINLQTGGAYIAANHNGPGAASFDGEIAEVIIYAENSSTTNRNKIESYLDMKYGITKSGNYVNSANTTIWNATTNSTYDNNVAVIGRDDGSGLAQKQSRSVNSGFQPVIGNDTTIAASNDVNTTSFSPNQSFLAWGSNTGSTSFSTAFEEGNRMNRIWKVQKTGTIGQVKVGVLSSDVSGVTFLNLLVSNDATFNSSDARYQMITETIGGLSYYTTKVNLTDGQFFTFMNSNTTLPLEVISFRANCLNDESVLLNWETASEQAGDHFIIEKSTDGKTWKTIDRITGAGATVQTSQYSLVCQNTEALLCYYRLTQYDRDSNAYAYPVIFSNCHTHVSKASLTTYPNPSKESLVVKYASPLASSDASIRVFTPRGKTVYQKFVSVNQGDNSFLVEKTWAGSGIYFIELNDGLSNVVRSRHIYE